jgi:hypothetical protein
LEGWRGGPFEPDPRLKACAFFFLPRGDSQETHHASS